MTIFIGDIINYNNLDTSVITPMFTHLIITSISVYLKRLVIVYPASRYID